MTQLHPNWVNAHVPDGFRVAAVGDIIITQPVYEHIRRNSPKLLDLLDTADVLVGNFEGTVLNPATYTGYPEALSGFGWLNSPPEVPADLAKLGFDLLSRANNHALDWGLQGMQQTNSALTQTGIVHAGTGDSLSAARAPAFVFGKKARVAFLSCATTFELNAAAGDGEGSVRPRPGLSYLRTPSCVLVSPEQFAVLVQIRDAQPAGSAHPALLAHDNATQCVTLMSPFGQRYGVDPSLDGSRVEFRFDPHPKDRAEIIQGIRQGKQSADFAIVAQHTHEPGNWSVLSPNYLSGLAKDMIDNGADIFCGHGPHQLRGIEIYKGKPIFHSLGNFMFMDNTQQLEVRDEWERDVWKLFPGSRDPHKMTSAEFAEWRRVVGVFEQSQWFESVLTISTYRGGKVSAIDLYPLELHWKGRDSERGIPRLANPETAQVILKRLSALSAPLGTAIEINDDVGRIQPSSL
ncbi:MAG: CapA family protein [Casimicrobium sp.]